MNRNKRKIFWMGILTLLTSIYPAKTYAARPLTVDDAGTVETGKFEVEAGYDFTDSEESSQAFTLGLKHGITEKMDLGIVTGWQFEPENGPESMEIGVKWALLSQKDGKPGISLTFSFAPGDPLYSLNGILSQPVGEKLTIHLNTGYSVPEALADGMIFWGTAVEFALTDKVNIVGEIFGEEDLSEQNEDARSWLVGANAMVKEFLILDVGAGTGIFSDPNWFFTLGATVPF